MKEIKKKSFKDTSLHLCQEHKEESWWWRAGKFSSNMYSFTFNKSWVWLLGAIEEEEMGEIIYMGEDEEEKEGGVDRF